MLTNPHILDHSLEHANARISGPPMDEQKCNQVISLITLQQCFPTFIYLLNFHKDLHQSIV